MKNSFQDKYHIRCPLPNYLLDTLIEILTNKDIRLGQEHTCKFLIDSGTFDLKKNPGCTAEIINIVQFEVMLKDDFPEYFL
ncbi:MAG: hypothetical protein J7L15_03650 [Clostridiales bacterium]|nr:hypothetical protein [Clostridiales bacterium]